MPRASGTKAFRPAPCRTLLLLLMILPAVLLSGCAGSRTNRPVEKWMLEYSAPAPAGEMQKASISVERFEAAISFSGPEMIYRPNPNQRDSYPYNRWWSNPADMLSDLLLRDLRRSRLFSAVLSGGQSGDARFRLEGWVAKFLEVDLPGGWRAELAVDLTLVDTADHSLPGGILMQKSYRINKPIKEKGAPGLARAMSQAAGELSGQALRDLAQAIKKAPANVESE